MRKTLIVCLGTALLGVANATAATFSVAPASVASDYTGDVTLSVGGLSAGQSVVIEAFGDDNVNGAIDSGEQLVLSLRVADGERATFPPSTTRLGPGDDDSATNSAVSKVLRLPLLAERLQLTGSYVFRLSGTGFNAMVRPFTITAGSHAQAVTGTITSGGSPLAGAFAVLLDANDEHDSEFVGGAVANAAGQFTVRVPVGNYNLLALKPGYVAEFASAPLVTLAAGVTSTQSVVLVPASRTISGSVVDGVTSNGIGGIQLFAQSQQGAITIAFSDAAGNFTIPITPGVWEIGPSENSAALPGYGGRDFIVDATSGDVTGVRLALSRALGDFELIFFFPSGGFSGGTNGSIGFPTRVVDYYALYGVEEGNVPTNVVFTGPSGSGLNNTMSANFGASFGGNSAFYSSPQIAVPPYPPAGAYTVNYKGYPQTFVLGDPDAANRQVVLVPTAFLSPGGQLQELRWTYRNTSGAVIAPPSFIREVEVRIDGIGGRLYDGEMTPDQTAHSVTSPVTWNDVSDIQMVYNDDRGNQYVSFWRRGTQPLQILSQTLPRGRVGSAYQYLLVAAGGLSPYNWSFVSGSLPQGVTFTPGTGELSGTPQAAGTFNFGVRVNDSASGSLERDIMLSVDSGSVAPRLEPRFGSPGQFALRFAGDVGRTYSLQYSTTLANWTTLLTTNLTAASADLTDTSATNSFRFYRITSP